MKVRHAEYRDFGAIMRGLGDTRLESVFGAEWINLDAKRRRLILQDFLEASEDDNLSASEYRSRIGAGNLKSYGDVMIVRERKGWD